MFWVSESVSIFSPCVSKPLKWWFKVCFSLLQPHFLWPTRWLHFDYILSIARANVWSCSPWGLAGPLAPSLRVLVRGWLVKRVLTRRGDSWALESTAAVVGDEEKLSIELFTGNCLFTVKGRLRWIESVTMKGSHTHTHTHINTPGGNIHARNQTWKIPTHTPERLTWLGNTWAHSYTWRFAHGCTHKSADASHTRTHTNTHTHTHTRWEQHRHLAGIEALFCLQTSPSLHSSSTQPQSRH